MKKVIGALLSFIMLVSTMCLPTVVTQAAAEIVPVYLNEKAITFASNDAQPQIYQNRTYVPVRATCDALGLAIDWNSKTETLTFSRAGITIAHTMRSKIVYINGVKQEFDTASINANNRTLMPIRMLAESIGATVNWDNATRSVHITTTSASTVQPVTEPTTATTVPVISSTANLGVSSFQFSSSNVAAGKTVTMTAIANGNTSVVRFSDASTGNLLQDVTEYTANSDGTRTFQANHTFTNSSSGEEIVTIKAQPGNGVEFANTVDSTRQASIIVKAADSSSNSSSEETNLKSDHMVKLVVDNKNPKKNEYVKVTATTTSKISKIKISNNFDADDIVTSEYDENDDGDRVFSARIKMTSTGTKKLYVTLYVKGEGYEDVDQSISISVDSSDSSSSSSSDDSDVSIKEVTFPNNFVYTNVDTNISVITNGNCKRVELHDEDDNVVTSSGFYTSKSGNRMTWTLSYLVSKSGIRDYTVYAYDADDNASKKLITINAKSWNSTSVTILDVTQKSSSVIAGDTLKLQVTASYGTKYVTVSQGTSSSSIATSDSGSSSGGDKRIFTLSFKIEDLRDSYYIRSYDADGNSGSYYEFIPNGDLSDAINISSVHLDSNTYSSDDTVEIEVHTSNSAYKVWIEDSRATRLSKVYKTPDEDDDDEYVWDMDFNPVDTGRKTYTVVAEDENGEQDTYNFTITVNS